MTHIDTSVEAADCDGQPSWSITWNASGTTYRERQWKASNAEARRMAAGQPHTIRFRRTTVGQIRELATTHQHPERPGTCICCQVPSPPQAQLTVTGAGLCWSCHHSHRDLTAHGHLVGQVPDPRCATRSHTPDGHVRDLSQNAPWRRDPRACVQWDSERDRAELQSWLRANGIPDAVVLDFRGDVIIGLGDLPDTMTIVEHDRAGWIGMVEGRPTKLCEPARHEVLDMLAAAHRRTLETGTRRRRSPARLSLRTPRLATSR